MIWVDGSIVPDDALKISVLDRSFEHGLGLFETLRTWNAKAPLLDRHLARLIRSAKVLQLPLGTVMLPDDDAVANLVQAEHLGPDLMLRITLTGGLTETSGATLWMRAAPLPPAFRREGAIVDLDTWHVEPTDPMAQHKSLNYWSRRRAHAATHSLGLDEVLSISGPYPETIVWEGSRTNLFVVRDNQLHTSPASGPIVPGIFRGLVLELAREISMSVDSVSEIRRDQLPFADEVFLTNSVRGIIPVSRATPHQVSQTYDWPTPGPWTQRLSILASDWLHSRGSPT